MKNFKMLVGLFFLIVISFYSCNKKTDNEIKEKKIDIEKESISIEDKIKIPTDFIKKYEIQKEEDLNYNDITRKQIRITVPSGLDKTELENNIKYLVVEYYKNKRTDGISILTYENGDNVENAYTVAMGEFAPFGEWEKINKNISLNDYQLKIEYKESYFQPKKEVIGIGSKIILFNESEWSSKQRKFVLAKNVSLSNSDREWSDENIIIKIPNNSKAEIIDIYREKLVNGSEIIRYKIKANYNGKNYQGWINSEEIKK